MTRTTVSIVIMLALIGAGAFSSVWVSRQCRELSAQAEELRKSLEGDDAEEASARAEELMRDWEHFRRRAGMLIKDTRLTEIDRMTARLPELAAAESDSAGAEVTELRELLDELRRNEIPGLTRLL